jgi:hypothetical protein
MSDAERLEVLAELYENESDPVTKAELGISEIKLRARINGEEYERGRRSTDKR